MNKNSEVTERIVHTSKLKLTNPYRINQLVTAFSEIWEKSKNPHYSVDFIHMMKGSGISYSTLLNIKKAALKRRLFVHAQGKAIRFRDDLCHPNEQMLRSLIVDEVQPHHVNQFKDYMLVNELQMRGFKVSR